MVDRKVLLVAPSLLMWFDCAWEALRSSALTRKEQNIGDLESAISQFVLFFVTKINY